MKLRLFALFLTGLLLTGCSQGTADDTGMGSSSELQGGSAEITSTAETDGTSADTLEADAAGEGNSDASGNSETEENSEAEEAYVLTFEAVNMEGEAVTSECFAQSKLTMLNVWATYCGPCLNEMPDLGEIAASYDAADFQMLGIVSDVVGEDAEGMEYAKELITQTGANYPHIPLNQSLYSNLVGGVDSVPTTFFVNQKGELLGYVIGAQSKETWEEIINNLLAEME